MNTNSETAPTSVRGPLSIVVDYDLPFPPEKVWRALTEPKLLEAWLMPNDIRAEVGAHFTFKTQPVAGWDGIVHCEVLEVHRPYKLVYAWKGGGNGIKGYGHTLDTTVTWTLAPTETGTRLRLDHAGFQAGAFAYEVMGKGWRGHVAQRMADVLAKAA